MWEIIKFFLCCIGGCCMISLAAFVYMIYSDDPCFIQQEPEEDWELKLYK